MCQRETDTYTEKEQGIDFDDIIHTIVKTSKSENSRQCFICNLPPPPAALWRYN